jgi:hypothetical protein
VPLPKNPPRAAASPRWARSQTRLLGAAPADAGADPKKGTSGLLIGVRPRARRTLAGATLWRPVRCSWWPGEKPRPHLLMGARTAESADGPYLPSLSPDWPLPIGPKVRGERHYVLNRGGTCGR